MKSIEKSVYPSMGWQCAVQFCRWQFIGVQWAYYLNTEPSCIRNHLLGGEWQYKWAFGWIKEHFMVAPREDVFHFKKSRDGRKYIHRLEKWPASNLECLVCWNCKPYVMLFLHSVFFHSCEKQEIPIPKILAFSALQRAKFLYTSVLPAHINGASLESRGWHNLCPYIHNVFGVEWGGVFHQGVPCGFYLVRST